MKKGRYFVISAAFAVCALIVCAFFVFADYSVGRYRVDADNGVKLYPGAAQSEYFSTIAPKGAVLSVERFSGGFGYTFYDSVRGWVKMDTSLFFLDGTPADTEKGRLVIMTPASKLRYVDGEERADTSGLSVGIVRPGSQAPERVKGYTVLFPPLDGVGKKSVNVTYKGLSVSYDIEVVRVPVVKTELTVPAALRFIEGTPVTYAGMSLKAYYSDGRNGGKPVALDPSAYTVDGPAEGDKTLAPGEYTVTVNYKYPEFTHTFTIVIEPEILTSLSIVGMPASTSIYVGGMFDPGDFRLEAVYNSGRKETIVPETVNYTSSAPGTFKGHIYYKNRYVMFEYTVTEAVVTGIQVFIDGRVSSVVGNPLSFANLRVFAEYENGSSARIADYTLSHKINKDKTGTYKVKVSFAGFDAEFDYYVVKNNVNVLGDVNADGEVNAKDARMALRMSANLVTYDETQKLSADVDIDGEVTAKDARKILRVSANLDTF